MANVTHNPVRSTTLLAKRQAWVMHVRETLMAGGHHKLAGRLPEPTDGLWPESANALELEIWRATGGDKSCRINFGHWGWYGRPSDKMLKSVNTSRAAGLINDTIDRDGLVDRPLTPKERRDAASRAASQGGVLSLFGGN